MTSMLVLAAEVPAVTDLLTGWRLVTSLLGIMAIAFLASRLLGARRSWGAVLVSGLTGWLAGAGLSVVLARNHEHGSAGFTRNLWLFSAFFTMSATVWIEMLAKPGALARAQSSLVSIPRPGRAIRRTTQRLGRYAQITRIAARHGLGRSLGIADDDTGEGRAPLAVRVRRALEEAGGMFVKLGQVVSTRADVVPPAVVAELSRLQDRVAPAPRADVEQLLEAELGRAVDAVFEDFDWEPIAAASIGQAYRARLSVRDTDRVDALGIDRPALADALFRCALQQMLVDGHFHSDPHPGNVLVLADGRLGLIDFGAAGRLDMVQQSSLRQMLFAVSQRDPGLLRQAILEVAAVRRGFDDDQFERALARFMARHLGPGAAPTAAMFNGLLQLLFSFGLALPAEFSTFFRALVTLEGTLTTLSPGYLVIDAAQRVASEWARERM